MYEQHSSEYELSNVAVILCTSISFLNKRTSRMTINGSDNLYSSGQRASTSRANSKPKLWWIIIFWKLDMQSFYSGLVLIMSSPLAVRLKYTSFKARKHFNYSNTLPHITIQLCKLNVDHKSTFVSLNFSKCKSGKGSSQNKMGTPFQIARNASSPSS